MNHDKMKSIVLACLFLLVNASSLVFSTEVTSPQPNFNLYIEPVSIQYSSLGISEQTESDLVTHSTGETRVSQLNVKDSYTTDLFTGSATYSFGFDFPPGVNGLQPQLSLNYNHHNAKSYTGAIGSGWDIQGDYISRDTSNTLSNTSDDIFNLHFKGITEKLIYDSSDGRHHTEHESYLYIKKVDGAGNTNGEYWILKTKDGTTYRFGYNPDSELVSNEMSFTIRWSLDKIIDAHNNEIIYSYSENPGADNGTVYLNKINYGSNEIVLLYQQRQKPLKVFYSNGNEVKQSLFLQSIDIKNSNSFVRSYDFSYRSDGNRMLLSEINLIGKDGYSRIRMINFSYYTPANNWVANSQYNIPSEAFFGQSSDEGTRLVDINGDGLADLIKMKNTSNLSYWINNGNGWSAKDTFFNVLDGGFVDDAGADQGSRFVDLNNDGKVDIIRLKSGLNSTRDILINKGNGWEKTSSYNIPSDVSFVNFTNQSYTTSWKECYPCRPYCDICPGKYSDYACSIDTERCSWNCIYYYCYNDFGPCGNECRKSDCDGCAARTKYDKKGCSMSCGIVAKTQYMIAPRSTGYLFADVNNDGEMDIIKSTPSERKVWIKKGYTWVVDNTWQIPSDASVIDSEYKDTGVRFFDVNGDGFADIVRGDNSVRKTWLNTAKGWSETSLWIVPANAAFIVNNDDKGVIAVDLNNDGLNDLIRGEGNNIAWLNDGSGWVEDSNWKIPADAARNLDDYSTRLNDLDGDGVIDMMRGIDSYGGSWNNDNGKAYLLKDIVTAFGGIITLNYSRFNYFDNTGEDNIQDLPFGGLIVSSITKNNAMSGEHKVISSIYYNYSNGFFDRTEKEFKGFGLVKEILPNNSTVSHWFYQDNAKKGLEYKAESLDRNNAILQKVDYGWQSEQSRGYYTIRLANTTDYTYDGWGWD